jgi:RND family efflux transporter MFP subunit
MIQSPNRLRAIAALLVISVQHNLATAGEVEGFTEPYRTINVAAAESGLIAALHIVEGDAVEFDQPLADLNQEVLKASLEIARAGRDATSTLDSAQAELTLRNERMIALRDLRDRGNASSEEVRRAELEHEISRARLLSAKENLEIKRLEFVRIQRQLDRRTVRSPIEGYVIEVYREVGEFVAPTDPIVATVVQLNLLRVTFSIPESYTKTMKTGRPVSLRIEGQPKPVKAEIELISPVVNAESQTVRVRVKLPNPDLRYRSGLKAFFVVEGMPARVTQKPTYPRTN